MRLSLSFTLLFAALVASFSGAAEHAHEGPAFLDPGVVMEMPPEWRARPIRYEEWAKGAQLAVTLDQHLYPTMLPHIEAFANANGVAIAVQEGTCGVSAGALMDRAADVAGFCCPPGAADRLPGLRYHTIGIAPLALLVSTDNPVRDITFAQAQDLYQGHAYYWSDLDAKAPKQPIHPVTRLHCKSRPGHWRLLLDNEDLFTPRAQEVGTIRDMMHRVAEDPLAIGYEVTWNISRFGLDDKVAALSVNGHPPGDEAALLAGRYPLYRTYAITTWDGEGGELARRLVAHLMERVEADPAAFEVVPPSALRAAGWRFHGPELVGTPE